MAASIDRNRLAGTEGMAGVTNRQIGRREAMNAQQRSNAASRGAGERAQFDAQEMAARGLLGSVDVMNSAGLPYYQAQGDAYGGWGQSAYPQAQQGGGSWIPGGIGAAGGAAAGIIAAA